ncbi:hypothetical protein HMPREF0766_13980 [Sphingobacterium spiritivorum ATCC 33861]|uniref:Uncharacterized protein n=1 Tax=Sphingobacterium spiritivorum ATCC 33861 TaxID=525373 RepID=D7VSM6_SPHSI|nr:hypothetical protein HMPREF0766_13980 [Sphingobacterium spiritivorum ATCC 33861]
MGDIQLPNGKGIIWLFIGFDYYNKSYFKNNKKQKMKNIAIIMIMSDIE